MAGLYRSGRGPGRPRPGQLRCPPTRPPARQPALPCPSAVVPLVTRRYYPRSGNTRAGPPRCPLQTLEELPLAGVSWLPCALPGGKDHCLALSVAADSRPRELVLRARSRDRVLDLAAQLGAAASQALAQRSLRAEIEAQQAQQREEEEEGPRAAEEEEEWQGGAEAAGWCSGGEGEEYEEEGGEEASLGSPAAASPLLPPSPSPAAPAGEPAAAAAAVEVAAPEAAAASPPVRLLSFSSRSKAGRVASHVQQLEAMVGQLSAEVAASRGGTPKVRAGAGGRHPSTSMAEHVAWLWQSTRCSKMQGMAECQQRASSCWPLR